MDARFAKVHEIALEARSWVEYEADKINDGDNGLSGWCAIASGELHKRLRRAGIGAEIHMAQVNSSCHVFVVVDDYVVDITATQFYHFRSETVLIKHVRELAHHWFYRAVDVFMSAKELRRNQIKGGWEKAQICYG